MIKSKKKKEYSTTFLKGNSGITYQVSNGSKLIIRYLRPEATKKRKLYYWQVLHFNQVETLS